MARKVTVTVADDGKVSVDTGNADLNRTLEDALAADELREDVTDNDLPEVLESLGQAVADTDADDWEQDV